MKKKIQKPILRNPKTLPKNWQKANSAHLLPILGGKSDAIQTFAVACASLNKELIINKSKHFLSVYHPNVRLIILGIGGTPTTIRLTSNQFIPGKDVGCDFDHKGYPTIVIERPLIEDVLHFCKIALARAGSESTEIANNKQDDEETEMKYVDGIPVWGEPLDNAVSQMKNCQKDADYCALMADHHKGYAVPIGGVVAYKDKISPSGVGFDIACGNKAVLLDADPAEVTKNISTIMDDIYNSLSFGVGRCNNEVVESPIFEKNFHPAWGIPEVRKLRQKAQSQLGTIGSGNHYVDLFLDEAEQIWCGVHFGSRGFGHKIATHYINAGGGKDGMDVDPVLLDVASDLGEQYILAMGLAGQYAYEGRDWVCDKIASILGASILDEVHNHHNFAWYEPHHIDEHLWVVRKGATPAYPGQRGFVGGSMGEDSVILEGVKSEESRKALYSTIHGAGRVMSRTQAAGKVRWKRGKKVRKSEGEISKKMMEDWVRSSGVELRGGGTDESPHCYKRLSEVLRHHENTVKILHTLRPIGVAMAGADEFDPWKD